MHNVSSVQGNWLELLRAKLAPGALKCAKVEKGHFVAVRAARPGAGDNAAGDFHALESCLGSLEGTRAIYLDSRSGLTLEGNWDLRSWAGDCATDVESGLKRAFAVVQMEIFRERIREELQARGWEVANHGENLRVSADRFSELVNVPREAVRMVLSRADFGTASRSIGQETGRRFARDACFFAAFETCFKNFLPATLDHFFIAYPERSCVAARWDYWQLAEREAEEAAAVFEEGMNEIELLLRTAREEGPAGLPAVASCGHGEGN